MLKQKYIICFNEMIITDDSLICMLQLGHKIYYNVDKSIIFIFKVPSIYMQHVDSKPARGDNLLETTNR